MPEFKLPDLGEGVTEGEVVEWRVREGGQVIRDQILVVVGTDKATVEIPSPFEGRVDAILAAEGARVEVGQPLIRVQTAGEDAGSSMPTPAVPPAADLNGPSSQSTVATSTRPRVAALPAVRRAARKQGIDLGTTSGSGPGGRVRMTDLIPAERRVPLRGPRRVMAERMAEAHRHVPQVTVVLECDFGPLEAVVSRSRDQMDISGRRSILGLIALATLAELAESPIFNATFDEVAMQVVYQDAIRLGIAVQTDDGLKVVTLRDYQSSRPDSVQRELDRLVAAARAGSLTAPELTGATFTISSGGRLGGLMATPLVNWPNLATLGVHEIEDRPVVRDGAVVVGRCANLSLSFDHRVIDGMTASAFLYSVRQRLSEPEQLGRGGAIP